MAAVHCVACNSQIDDSRERRVYLDVRTRHVLPYFDELARSLDSHYDEFTRYIVLVYSFSSNETRFLQKLATWSFIRDRFSGDNTNTIEVPSGTLRRLSMTGRQPKHAGFSYPVGKLTKTSLPSTNERIALSCSCLKTEMPSLATERSSAPIV